ncbi:hypothetical protein NBRC116188_29790 [Oceaniserpentilla sp. 4NH20-0058]|uniref:helix-turn-helix transcriptional regulator n=1 Tax=Oceaniserpentilla sp. 4NH20-0058 TaxID=3127660 RepID=UPI003104F57D
MQARVNHDQEHILAKALIRASEALGLQKKELAEVVGVNPSQISRLQETGIKTASKEWEIATYVIRIARGLHALNNGDSKNTQHFMSTYNQILQATPKTEIKRLDGLLRILNFVDAFRGKV